MHGRVEMSDFLQCGEYVFSPNLIVARIKKYDLSGFVMGLVTGEIFIQSYALLPKLYHFKKCMGVLKCVTWQFIFVEPFSCSDKNQLLRKFVI